MTQEELDKVLKSHLHWLREDCDGWESMRACLAFADLKFANLKGANLTCANLKGANLVSANLEGANFRGTRLELANLECANLKGTNLECANLEGTNLVCANLEGTNLKSTHIEFANLKGTNLRFANLEFANLKGTNLICANLKGANLRGANLELANLKDAILKDTKNLPFIPIACPDTGSFIGWKKVGGKIIKLKIPADAKRGSATSSKCRCNKAKVLEIQEIDGSISDKTKISSDYDKTFIYEVGKTVSVKDFCEDRWRECSQGIHFFINRQSAVEY